MFSCCKTKDNETKIQKMSSMGHAKAHLVKDHDTRSSLIRIEDIYDGVPRAGTREGHFLGDGGTARVFKIVHKKTKKEYALKIVNLTEVSTAEKKEMLLQEIPIIRLLDHPNVIKVVEVFRKLVTVYIVMELCTGGELFDKLYDQPGEKFAEGEARFLVTKMLSALSYLHRNGIVHRDLKLENFIFTSKKKDADIKLIDFGFSTQYLAGQSKLNEVVGTCYYMAPEVLGKNYTQSSDLWSLGVIVFMMVTGLSPFMGKGNRQIMDSIRQKSKNPDGLQTELENDLIEAGVSQQCCDFVLGLMTVDTKKRLTADMALAHEWIKSDHFLKSSDKKARPTKTKSTVASVEHITVTRLRENIQYTHLQRNALFAMAFEMTSSELKELNAMFEALDTNHDGSVSYEEFKETMKKFGHTSPKTLKDIFKSADRDGSGTVQYTEFLGAAMELGAVRDTANVEVAFYRLDLDNSGYISKSELATMIGEPEDSTVIAKVLESADVDKDGKISVDEFKKAMFCRTIPPAAQSLP